MLAFGLGFKERNGVPESIRCRIEGLCPGAGLGASGAAWGFDRESKGQTLGFTSWLCNFALVMDLYEGKAKELIGCSRQYYDGKPIQDNVLKAPKRVPGDDEASEGPHSQVTF